MSSLRENSFFKEKNPKRFVFSFFLFSLELFNFEIIIKLWKNYKNSTAAAASLQSCPTLCDPIDGSPLGSAIPGILQARTLEWVAISFSNA